MSIESIIWFGSMVVAIIADIYLAQDRISGNTWSEITRHYAEKALIIPWISGVLNGHFFHFFSEGQGTNRTHIFILIALTIPVIATSFFLNKFVSPFPNWLLIVVFQLGLFAGIFLWRV